MHGLPPEGQSRSWGIAGSGSSTSCKGNVCSPSPVLMCTREQCSAGRGLGFRAQGSALGKLQWEQMEGEEGSLCPESEKKGSGMRDGYCQGPGQGTPGVLEDKAPAVTTVWRKLDIGH